MQTPPDPTQWVVDQANEIEGVEAEIVDIASFNLPLVRLPG